MTAEESRTYSDPAALESARNLIRERARAARQGIAPGLRAQHSLAASERLLASLPAPWPRVVLGYAATPEEIDPAHALEQLRAAGSIIAYPRVTGPGAMTLHTCRPDELEPGPFGLLQPCGTAVPVGPSDIGLVIVPGVAFDASGHRLGYGGGYYDRLLAGMALVRRTGLCFDSQVVEEIPSREHDIRMHEVVTPTRTLRVQPRL